MGAIMGRVTPWQDVEQAEPEFAQRVRALFDAHQHKTIATLRADGSPRISGIETVFEEGELVFGSMPNARKGADLTRDPRFALHSATIDPVEGSEARWPGEAKILRPGDRWRTDHRRTRRRPFPRRHRGRSTHPPQRGGNDARHRVVDAHARASKGRAGVTPHERATATGAHLVEEGEELHGTRLRRRGRLACPPKHDAPMPESCSLGSSGLVRGPLSGGAAVTESADWGHGNGRYAIVLRCYRRRPPPGCLRCGASGCNEGGSLASR